MDDLTRRSALAVALSRPVYRRFLELAKAQPK